MRVLLLTTDYVEIVLSLANSLSKMVETKLMIPKKAAINYLSENYSDLVSSSLLFETFDMPRFRSVKNFKLIAYLIKRIRLFNPNIIHLQDLGHPWLALAYPFLSKYPIVSTIHDPEPHFGDNMNKGRLFEDAFRMRIPDSFIVHGNQVKQQLHNLTGLSNQKINVIPFGGFPLKKSEDEFKIDEIPNTVLFFGRIWPYKGIEYLIKAEPLIRKQIPGIRIVIAGSGDNIDKYTSLIDREESFVIHNYHIPNNEVLRLFQEASLVVVPYIEATQSSIPPLAFQFGKPVIVTDVGSLTDMVDNGKQGFVVPPKDEQSLADAIIKILKDNSLRVEMGIQGKKKIENELSYDTIAKKTMRVYSQTLISKYKL